MKFFLSSDNVLRRRWFWAGDQSVSEPSCYEPSPVCGVFSVPALQCITSLLQMYRITQPAHCSQYPLGPGEWRRASLVFITSLLHWTPSLKITRTILLCIGPVVNWYIRSLFGKGRRILMKRRYAVKYSESVGIEDCENSDMHLFKLRRLSIRWIILKS